MIKICWFSGTGNTLWSAKKIARDLGDECELINVGPAAREDKIHIEADKVILLFPAYAYGAPVLFRRFVKKAVFKTPYIAVFVTYGTSPGGALAEISRILKRGGITAAYFGRIPAVENYIALFGPQRERTINRRLQMQSEATQDAVRAILENRRNTVFTFRPLSAFVSTVFALVIKFFYRWYKVSADCNGCGLCKKVCPAAAIVMRNGKPVFSAKCEHCNGCLNWCPQKAIHFGRINSRTPRYHHPEINLSALEERSIQPR